MGDIIVKHTIDSGEVRYLIWSPVVDAPVTYGMTLKQLKQFWREEYGRHGMADLESRLKDEFPPFKTIADLCRRNRAGHDQTQISAAEIVDYYIIRRGKGEHPVGKSWSEIHAEEAALVASKARLSEAVKYGTHCLHPDTCNPDKKDGCVCNCTGCFPVEM